MPGSDQGGRAWKGASPGARPATHSAHVTGARGAEEGGRVAVGRSASAPLGPVTPTTEAQRASSLLPRACEPRQPTTQAGGAASAHLICGMHPAVAEHTLERTIAAYGGLAGLLRFLAEWETTCIHEEASDE